MKSRSFKKVIPFAILFAAIISFSSCNRGTGCPDNFSMSNVVTQSVDIAVDIFLRK